VLRVVVLFGALVRCFGRKRLFGFIECIGYGIADFVVEFLGFCGWLAVQGGFFCVRSFIGCGEIMALRDTGFFVDLSFGNVLGNDGCFVVG
jgi:hypothetical protein